MFSRRANWSGGVNRLTRVRERLAAEGREILDLTVSNPTRAAIDYPHEELAEAMRRGARAPYDPEPLGIRSAREAVAEQLRCDVDDVVITASTSEAYSHLFKLLTDPGHSILTATPTYPLLEHLAMLELVQLRAFPLQFHRRWEIERTALVSAMTPETRAIVLVNPNNPTGSYVTESEQRHASSIGVPIISDEVFFDYPFVAGQRTLATVSETLTFILGGLSKSAGLPHYKLGWIQLSGPEKEKRAAVHGLELIADNFLSVSTPVQHALPDLLTIGARIRESIRSRIASNLATLQADVVSARSASLLPVEGGWSAVLRVPRTSSDEDLAITMLEEDGVSVHPGYFFDFASDGYIVLSLLTPPDTFGEGLRRLLLRVPM